MLYQNNGYIQVSISKWCRRNESTHVHANAKPSDMTTYPQMMFIKKYNAKSNICTKRDTIYYVKNSTMCGNERPYGAIVYFEELLFFVSSVL
jgi:hypothetical protein